MACLDSTTLGRALNMLPSTLTRVVDRLVERGLIERLRDRQDRRIVHLEATEEGDDLVLRLLGAG